jgi:hypothetical protein
MWTLGPFGFAAPWALLALIGLPIIWLVVRAIPPRPKETIFPPADILRTVPKTEETPAKAPPWLALIRAIVLLLVVLGLARPVLNPTKVQDARPLLLIIDNGWTAAPIWSQIQDEAASAARGANGQVRVIFTAPQNASDTINDTLLPSRAAARIAAAMPQPVLADHLGTARIVARLPKSQQILWFSDNVGRPGTTDLAGVLGRLGSLRLRVIASPAIAITRSEATSHGYSLGLVASAGAKSTGQLEAIDARARVVAGNAVDLGPSGVTLPVEAALTRDIAALRIGDARSAGGVFLLDAFDRRVRTGLVAARQDDQPLLSDAHYLEEALSPYAEITRGEIERLANSGLDAILLPDAGVLPPREASALKEFVEKGGILVRFAGPRLIAAEPSILLPAPVSSEARALRGALAWDNAGSLGGFDRAGPFAGLTIPPDARVNQLAVLAPTAQGQAPALAPQIWAQLADGLPLVTAAPLGRGWRVLFHTTAGPAWSDVAFSGLQVSMLRRVLARAGSSTIPAKAILPTAPLRPTLVLDGYGNFRAPAAGDLPIAPQNVGNAKPDARHPPGIYEGGGSRLILQAAGQDTFLPSFPPLPGVQRVTRAQGSATAFGPALLAIGLILVSLDALMALAFAGQVGLPKGWKIPKRVIATIMIAFMSAAVLMSHNLKAQPAAPAPKATPADLSLAFIRTGDAATDARAKAGLEGLSRVLAARTSVEPGAVVAVDPAKTDLALFPILYWLLPDRPIETSPEVARALDRYMKSGGVVFVDSRGAGREPAAARAIARAALRGIEAPPLEQVPDGHVLTKSFYILRGFPGRYQNAKLWVETNASAAASANDGVSPIIVGDGDWASAWANANSSVTYGDYTPAQRNQEIAARVGVNVVLYALTGNYKADQVHFETLLRRLTPR